MAPWRWPASRTTPLEHFKRALFDPRPLGALSNPPEARSFRPKHPTRDVAHGGRATGPLIGGNLTLIREHDGYALGDPDRR